MAQKSGFFTSSSGDRKYGSDWLAQYIAAIVSNGVYTTELTVSGDNGNMSVTVGAGRAWINGYMYSNDSNMTMALSAADGALSRTDLVVLRLDMTNRQITLAVVQGDFGGGVPALTRTSDIYELCLAQIAVAAGTTEISAQMITDTRADETACGIVAGAVTQLSTGELLNQLKAGFEEWFDGIKGQLSEDAAGNLQNQIDDCVKLNDKATEDEAIIGTNDTKWMTPEKTALVSNKVKLLQSYTVAGTVSYTVQKTGKILVLIIGAGGSGGVASTQLYNNGEINVATGGCSGGVNAFVKDVVQGEVISGIVGTGGASVSKAINAGSSSGNAGGTTSFNGITASGGPPGNGGTRNTSGYLYGTQASSTGQSSRTASTGNTPKTPYMYESISLSSGVIIMSLPRLLDAINLATIGGKPPFHVGAGGGSLIQFNSGTLTANNESASDVYGATLSGGASSTLTSSATVTAVKGTDPGCGGGAAVVHIGTATSAAGADGGIFIYEVRD